VHIQRRAGDFISALDLTTLFLGLTAKGVPTAEIIEEVDVVRAYIALVDETDMPWVENGAVIQE
jgi:hypothetical protein